MYPQSWLFPRVILGCRWSMLFLFLLRHGLICSFIHESTGCSDKQSDHYIDSSVKSLVVHLYRKLRFLEDNIINIMLQYFQTSCQFFGFLLALNRNKQFLHSRFEKPLRSCSKSLFLESTCWAIEHVELGFCRMLFPALAWTTTTVATIIPRFKSTRCCQFCCIIFGCHDDPNHCDWNTLIEIPKETAELLYVVPWKHFKN